MNSIEKQIEELKQKDQYRELKQLIYKTGSTVQWQGKDYLNLSSNDYLGLSHDLAIMQEFLLKCGQDFDLSRYALTSSSSRLLTGNSSAYDQLENSLCEWYERPAGLVFNSGYHANLGILSALSSRDTVIFSDKLNHASLIDGMRMSGHTYYRYNHLDYGHLERHLEKYREKGKQALIVSESLFSMDGDIVDIPRLVQLKHKYDCLLYIDEAHGVGARGHTGLGICEEQNCVQDIDFIVGTFGKALGSVGAYVMCETPMRDWLINTVRPFIFTTALPPLNLQWTIETISRVRSMTTQREHLKDLSTSLRTAFTEAGLATRGASHIVPLILGENEKAVLMAKRLQQQGYLVFPIRPPTVPPHTARLRFSLHAKLSRDQLKDITKIIEGRV